MKMKWGVVFVLGILSVQAQAQWKTRVESEAFPKATYAIMTGMDGKDRGIEIGCESGTTTLSLLKQQNGQSYGHTEQDSRETYAMRLTIGKETLELDFALANQRNDGYIAFEDQDYLTTQHALYLIRNAKAPIELAVQSDLGPVRVTIPAAGARKAADTLSRVCHDDLRYGAWKP